MRNKIKEIMNKEEGFTLVELLAVIVILGIIVAIAIPAIGNITGRAEKDADQAEKELIVDAARLYDIENEISEGDDGVSVDTLVDEGYLELRGNDAEGISGKVTVERTASGGTKYTYVP